MGLITSFTRGVYANEFPAIETSPPWLMGTASTITNNVSYFVRVPRLFTSLPVSNTKVYNGATVNGNYAVSVYASFDDGTTATRLGGTGTTAQSGTNAQQIAALTASFVIPAGVPLWIVFSTDSATGTFLRSGSWPNLGIVGNKNRSSASYNITSDVTIGSLTAAALYPWVQVY